MTLFLVIVAVLALLVSFGKHLPPVSYVLLHFVPFFGKFRAPVMILVQLQFAVALLAGYGAHALAGRIRAGKDVLGTFAKRLCLVAGGVLLLAVGLTAFETSFQSLMTGIYEQADAASRQGNAIPGNADYQTRINAMRFEQLMDDPVDHDAVALCRERNGLRHPQDETGAVYRMRERTGRLRSVPRGLTGREPAR